MVNDEELRVNDQLGFELMYYSFIFIVIKTNIYSP